MTNKDKEIMDFLHEKVFDPVLNDKRNSKDVQQVKKGVNFTIMCMNKLDLISKIKYFWSVINGTVNSNNFTNRMERLSFTTFYDVRDEFRIRFDDKWLKSK